MRFFIVCLYVVVLFAFLMGMIEQVRLWTDRVGVGCVCVAGRGGVTQ